MAGSTFEFTFDSQRATASLGKAYRALTNPAELQRDIGEYLLRSTRNRFNEQAAPDGTAWEALSSRYKNRKRKNKDKILTLDGYLRGAGLRYQLDGADVLMGSNRPYAAIHQFGGDISIPARSQYAFFRQAPDGSVGNLFVKKKKSNFAQRVTIGAHVIHMPARPFLGLSVADEEELVQLGLDHIGNAVAG
ncbi:phage virion morphogenesis protein [Glaciimonas immobilis]|uniref:Phage virion morphogenesis protein n=1 Tax=Glaciimonas immobilis TaxID=728004 RepID=A0A840RJW6_9BURK|nr:phage virion morphogenesis protein [Glaciimonas immobilis]KAF3999057.1 phage virion morphogenesis protein [Glaciimonas immobilis]MBB5198487.1 phage virion morphogenesis protein [Glaciimonas immobilis]